MGLGGTAKKLQKVVDMADDLYAKISDLREELVAVRNSIDETKDRVSSVETELQEQRVLLERIAEAEGVDTELTDTNLEPAGDDGTETPSETTEAAQE
jgi:flagellin-like hook-associated protein FlgL